MEKQFRTDTAIEYKLIFIAFISSSFQRSSGTATATDSKLSENMFHFPTCRVSECIPEFFNLVYRTLVEATESNKTGYDFCR